MRAERMLSAVLGAAALLVALVPVYLGVVRTTGLGVLGDPVPATVVRCFDRLERPRWQPVPPCWGEWTRSGRPVRGEVLEEFDGPEGAVVPAATRGEDRVTAARWIPAASLTALGPAGVVALAGVSYLVVQGRAASRRAGGGVGARFARTAALRGVLGVTGAVLAGAGAGLVVLGAVERPWPALGWGAGLLAAGLVAAVQVVVLLARWPFPQPAGPVRHPQPGAAPAPPVPRVRPVGRRPVSTPWSHRAVPLDVVVEDALRLAARAHPYRPVGTGRLLEAVVRLDVHSDWARLWRHTGDPAESGLAAAVDPAGEWPPDVRDGVRLTGPVVAALTLLDRLAWTHALTPAGSALTALVLVADPGCGAVRALTARSGVDHARLLALVRAELVEHPLDGLAELVPGAAP